MKTRILAPAAGVSCRSRSWICAGRSLPSRAFSWLSRAAAAAAAVLYLSVIPDQAHALINGNTINPASSITIDTMTIVNANNRAVPFSIGGSTFVVRLGRVGIGEPIPGNKLHVSSGIIAAIGAGAGIKTTGNGTAAAFFANGAFSATVGALNGFAQEGGYWGLRHNGTRGLSIDTLNAAAAAFESMRFHGYYETDSDIVMFPTLGTSATFYATGGVAFRGGILAHYDGGDFVKIAANSSGGYIQSSNALRLLADTQYWGSEAGDVAHSTYTAATARLDVAGPLTTASFLQVTEKSRAQLEALTPSATNQIYACSNCLNGDYAVISTGVAVCQFAALGPDAAWH